MSGYFKIEKDLLDSMRFKRLVNAVRRRPDCPTGQHWDVPASESLVLGALVRLWRHADDHIRSDDTLDMGPVEINQLVGIAGFAELFPADWLKILDEYTVELPNYHAHNNLDASRKEKERVRKAIYRATQKSLNQTPVPLLSHDTSHGTVPPRPVTRLDETRQDLLGHEPQQAAPVRKKPRTALTKDQQPTEADMAYTHGRGPDNVDWGSTWNDWRDFHLAKGTLAADWAASWRTWVNGIATKGYRYARKPMEPSPARPAEPRISAAESHRIAAGESLEQILASRPDGSGALQPRVVERTPRLSGESVSAWLERAKSAGV